MAGGEQQRIPIEAGFFTIPESPEQSPRLLGSRCVDCDEHFFPRRVVCAKCLSCDLEDVELGPDGSLYTFTYVHVPMFGSRDTKPGGYGVGQIDMPEGPRVQAVLSGGPHDFEIGMTMRLELEPLRETSDGHEIVIFRFRPVAEVDAA